MNMSIKQRYSVLYVFCLELMITDKDQTLPVNNEIKSNFETLQPFLRQLPRMQNY